MTPPVRVPLLRGLKKPFLKQWNSSADLLPREPGPNEDVGYRCDGLTAVDCDGPACVDWWEANGPKTPYVTQSRPGRRIYWYGGETISPGYYHWVLPDGSRGGEVRCGYKVQCVVPPSMHPTGTTYMWLGPALLDTEDAPSLPVEALPPRDPTDPVRPEALNGWTEVHTAPDVIEWLPNEWCPAKPECVSCVGGGTGVCTAGHHSPGLALGQLEDGRYMPHCRGGCIRSDVIEALVAEGRYTRDELWPEARDVEFPWDEDIRIEEQRHLARDQLTRGTNVACLPIESDFPVDALPETLRRLVYEGARSICCPPDYLGAASLAILGAAIGSNVTLRLTSTWTEKPCLWVAAVGDPGARKTPALKPLMDPVWSRQRELSAENVRAVDEEKRRAKETKGQPTRVPLKKVVVNDTTMEALHRTLMDNPNGVLMFKDELTGWVREMGSYKGGLGGDRQAWLSIWAGQSFSVDRKGSEYELFVSAPFVPIVGGIQPDVLGDISGGRDDGLIDRLLLAHGTAVPAKMIWEGVSEPTLLAYRRLWSQMAERGVMKRVIVLTDQAREEYEEWHDRIASEPVAGVLRGVWAKMPAQCARIALILSQLDLSDKVDQATMQRAIHLADYFMGQARRVLVAGTDSLQDKEHSNRVEALRGWMESHPGATKRDILRSGPGRWSRRSASLDPVLKDLVEAFGVAH